MPYAPKQSIKEGYEKFVIKNSEGCWEWKGCCPKNPGYGQFRSRMKIYRAHIASWIIHKGEILKGKFVCHKCDNKRCSNPEHLFLATCKENNLDAIKKNIHPTMGKKRDQNHRTKIFVRDFPKIIELRNLGYTFQKIADYFHINRESIRRAYYQAQGVGY